MANLEDIQGEKMATPTLLISDQVGGLEDIPQGVVAVVVDGGMDVLSHVAIRARNQVCVCAAYFRCRSFHMEAADTVGYWSELWLWY